MKSKLADLKKLGMCPEEKDSDGKINIKAKVHYCLEMETLLGSLIKLAQDQDHSSLQYDIYCSQMRENIINQFQLEDALKIKEETGDLTGEDALIKILEWLKKHRESRQFVLDYPSQSKTVLEGVLQ